MFGKLSGRIYSWAKGWLILILFIIEIVFNATVLTSALKSVQAASNSPKPLEGLDTQFFYTPDRAYSILSSYNDNVRVLYRNFELTGDIITPILYTSFLSLFISWLFRKGFKPGSFMRKLNIVPFGAGISDILENCCIVTMLSFYPARLNAVAMVSTVFTMLKWSLVALSFLLVITGIVKAILNRKRTV